jgi:hypothetical protein
LGNFQELQCQEGLCFCVNGTTGVITGPFVPRPSIDQLPCCENRRIVHRLYAKQNFSYWFLLLIIFVPLLQHLKDDKGLLSNGYFGGEKTCGAYKDRFARIRKLYAEHGTDVQGLASINCGFDHSYAPKFCDNKV